MEILSILRKILFNKVFIFLLETKLFENFKTEIIVTTNNHHLYDGIAHIMSTIFSHQTCYLL